MLFRPMPGLGGTRGGMIGAIARFSRKPQWERMRRNIEMSGFLNNENVITLVQVLNLDKYRVVIGHSNIVDCVEPTPTRFYVFESAKGSRR